MNILLYVLDSLRADHISCYGYERKTTPNIDELANDGIRYDNCFTPSTWTKPVAGSLLTGAYPPVHGAQSREDTLPPEIIRFPELLSDNGFKTAGFSTMGNVSSATNCAQGFDDFFDLYKDEDIIDKREITSAAGEELEQESQDKIALPRSEDINDKLINWLEGVSSDFFALCWSIDTHAPFTPPDEFREFTDSDYSGPIDGTRQTFPKISANEDISHLIDLYNSEIYYNDLQLGKLMDHLKENGLYENTMVVIVGDHGEAFFEHDHFTHGHQPHNEVSNVPLIIKPPGDHKRTIREELVSLIDICPTILRTSGIEYDTNTIQGVPLLPFNKAEFDREAVYSETAIRDVLPSYYSIRTNEWSYIRTETPDRDVKSIVDTVKYGYRAVKQLYDQSVIDLLKNPGYFISRYRGGEDEYLYNIEVDPKEQDNVINNNREIANELDEKIDQWFKECSEIADRINRKDTKQEIDADTNEQLRQLGYLD